MGSSENKTSASTVSEAHQNNKPSQPTEIISENDEGSDEADEDEGVKGVEVFEDLLDIIGTSGPWNIIVFFLCNIATAMSCMQMMTYEFIGATPDHWCQVEALLEANWTQHQVLNLAIPQKNDSTYEKCQMYNYNYTLAAELGYELAMENLAPEIQRSDNVIPCSSRDFNRTQYESTLVTEFDLVCKRRALYSTTQAVSQLGVLLSSLVIGPLSNTIGRRRTSVCFVVMVLSTGLCTCASTSIEIYIVLKTISSFSAYMIYASNFVLLIELCSLRQRSSVGSLFLVPWALGYMIVPGIAYFVRAWRLLQAAYTLPYLLLFSYFWLLPESPRWLISSGRYEEALEVLSWAAKVNKRPLPPLENIIVSMKKIRKMQGNKEAKVGILREGIQKIKDLVVLFTNRQFRSRMCICAICWFSVSIVYYGISLGSSNLSADPYLFIFLGGVIELPSYLLLWPSLAYLGRKISMMSQFLFCGLIIAIASTLILTVDDVPVGLLMFLSLAGKFAITATFHLLFIYTAELFPTDYRSIAVGEGSIIARLGSIASPFVVDLLGGIASWSPSLLFAGFSLLSAGLAVTLPETADAVLNEKNSFDDRGRQDISQQQKVETSYTNEISIEE